MYLGIDLGTSGVKALLLDEAQTSVASATAPLKVSRPHPGWSEQNPADWISATQQALEALKASHPQALAAVKGIGLSGQMHGATLLNAHDQVLRPAILWNDTRSYSQAEVLNANPVFHQISGNLVFPGFTAPKLVWVKHNEPEIFSQIAKVLLPKDYLRLWLTGEYVADLSDAAGTSWLNVAKRAWSPELLENSHMDIQQMPRLVEGTEVSGTLRKELAKAWGIEQTVVVAGGAGDNAASACGLGIIAPGRAFISLGTSGVIFAANAAYQPNVKSAVHTFCHAVPQTWHQMGVILSATDALNWYAQLVKASPSDLTHALGETLQAPSKLLFLPYLAGERTPHNDANIRGAFIGLDHGHDQYALTRAVLEGVAFALKDNLIALQSAGTELERLMAVGGGARSAYWLALMATVLNVSIDVPQEGELGAAFGAARLGLIAAESAAPEAVLTPPDSAKTFEPDPQLQPIFEETYSAYHALYPALSNLSH